MPSHAMYLSDPMENPEDIPLTVDRLLPVEVKKQRPILVGTGLSGTLALGILRVTTDFTIAVVRKDGDGSHSGRRVECSEPFDGRPWVFLDDLIESGRTFGRVLITLEQEKKRTLGNSFAEPFNYGPCLGALLYDCGGKFRYYEHLKDNYL